ncbi:hypothetical protein ABPG75_010520 [Micractinium tetrahymenae]
MSSKMRKEALADAPGRATAVARPPPCLLDALPDDLLYTVFTFVDETSRVCHLPLVCRRFAALVRRPGACWQRLAFEGRRWPNDEAAAAEQQRLLGFLRWAAPRAGSQPPAGAGARELRLSILPAVHVGRDVIKLFHKLLHASAPTLLSLELRAGFPLHVGGMLPPHLQQRMTVLTRLELVGENGIYATKLGQLTALQRLNLVDDGERPCALYEESTLPPSLTWLGLTPAPWTEQAHGGEAAEIPECVLALPALRFLDVSESLPLRGLEEALPRLTGLTGLPVSFEPLAALRDMRVLSLSECPRMRQLPPPVAGLTNLRALHVEKCGLEALPEDLHLPRCQMLSIDWHMLLASHHVLPRLPALQQLILGAMTPPDQPFAAQPPAAEPADTEAVVASLARCAALRRISVLVYPDAPLSLEAAALMLVLPRRCPAGLQLAAVSSTEFFLTDSVELTADD